MLIPSEAVREVYPRPLAWLLVLLTILGVHWPVEAPLPFHGIPSVRLFAYVYVHVCVCVRICVCVCLNSPFSSGRQFHWIRSPPYCSLI